MDEKQSNFKEYQETERPVKRLRYANFIDFVNKIPCNTAIEHKERAKKVKEKILESVATWNSFSYQQQEEMRKNFYDAIEKLYRDDIATGAQFIEDLRDIAEDLRQSEADLSSIDAGYKNEILHCVRNALTDLLSTVDGLLPYIFRLVRREQGEEASDRLAEQYWSWYNKRTKK